MSAEAETKLNVVVTEKVLATLAEFWQHPVPERFSGRMPVRIAGSKYDQQIPEGTRNPHWEIVRQMPVSSIDLQYQGIYSPDSYWFAPGDDFRQLADRYSLCATFAWSIISPGDVAWIRERLNGAGIVEPGAGHGYWAWQLAQAGVDVVAYEPAVADANSFVIGEPWFPVQQGDHMVTAGHPDRSLLLCWPSYSESWAAEALRAYKGGQLFFAGEGPGGCTADDAFFDLLDAEWDEVADCPYHVTYSGIHCYLTEYRRKAPSHSPATHPKGSGR